AVPVEILEDRPARQPDPVESDRGSDVREAADVPFRGEGLRTDAPALRHAIGPVAERHVGQVEKPARVEIVGLLLQDRLVLLAGPVGAIEQAVDASAPDRHEARGGVVVVEAVLLLAEAEGGGTGTLTHLDGW